VKRNADDTWTSDAIQRGDVDAVKKRVVDDTEYLSFRDDVGDTPLLTAISFGSAELVGFMLEHGADPNVDVDDGHPGLLSAAESNDPASVRIVAALISAGADIHGTETFGWTPLHGAAARGHVDKARLLIDAGAHVNQRQKIDASETPLMEAAYRGHPEMVRFLLSRGADPTMRDTIHRRTPLETARYVARGTDPTVYNYLKDEPFDLDPDEIVADMDLSPEELALAKSVLKNLDMAKFYRENADKLARDGDHEGVIRVLLEHESQQASE